MSKIGFMQGRLSSMVNGRIQAFPWRSWREEFSLARQHGFKLMEWTLDQERLYENPLMTSAGQSEIRALCQHHSLEVASLTGDCFMQAPFWKARGIERDTLQADFIAIANACATVGISIIVVPLVDNGRIETLEQENNLIAFLHSQTEFLREHDLHLVFESDFAPDELARFIERFDSDRFGINYDIGNSAGLGFNPLDEFSAYGKRILNVHIKDRMLEGSTVPLGTGNANFPVVFAALAQLEYNGNYILQTARAVDGNHAGVLCRYRDMAVKWIDRRAA